MSFFKKLFGYGEDDEINLAFPPPPTFRDLSPVGLYCDDKSYQAVAKVYNDLFPNSAEEKIRHLNPLVKGSSYWGEMFLYVHGPFWGMFNRTISDEEASLIPSIGSAFRFNPSLGMLVSKNKELIFLNIKPARRCGIVPPGATINDGINIEYCKNQIKQYGWNTKRF